jgi:hypothetical protein
MILVKRIRSTHDAGRKKKKKITVKNEDIDDDTYLKLLKQTPAYL